MGGHRDVLKLAVAIATAGRRDILTETVMFFDEQSRKPEEFLICPARPEDVDTAEISRSSNEVHVISGEIGLPAQRNAMITASNADVIVFFDDDFLPAQDYLAEVERLFASEPDIVIATGHVIADGAQGAGLDFGEGRKLLDADDLAGIDMPPEPTFNGYGCNMAVRMRPLREGSVRFDENLPLYAWLEDVDFSRQLASSGRIVKANKLRGVHLGTKRAGRSSGRRLGYSQVANRLYIKRKGHMSGLQAWNGILRNLLANLLKSPRPEPWVDRRGRLLGNLLGFRDLLTGKLDPRKINSM